MSPPLQSPTSLIGEIRSMPRPVFVLVAGMFLNRLGSFVYPFLALYLRDKSFDYAHVSGVIAALAAGNFFGPMAGGYLADAIGRRNTLVASLFTSAGLLMVMYWADNYAALIVSGMVYGFAVSTFGPPADALLTDLVPAERRATAYALYRLAINAGFAAGPTLAGLLYAVSPFWIFFGDALTTLVFGVLSWMFLPHGLRSIRGRVTSPQVVWSSWVEAVVDAWRNPRFRQFILAALLMGVAFSQMFSLLAISATDRGLSTQAFGLVMGLNGLLIILIELPVTHWLKRFAAPPVLAIGYVMIGLGCAGFAMAESIVGHMAAMTVFTLGEIIALPIGMAYSSLLAPDHLRGRYFGVRGMTWATSSLIASAGVWCYGQIGAIWWTVVGGFAFLGAVAITRKLSATTAVVPDEQSTPA